MLTQHQAFRRSNGSRAQATARGARGCRALLQGLSRLSRDTAGISVFEYGPLALLVTAGAMGGVHHHGGEHLQRQLGPAIARIESGEALKFAQKLVHRLEAGVKLVSRTMGQGMQRAGGAGARASASVESGAAAGSGPPTNLGRILAVDALKTSSGSPVVGRGAGRPGAGQAGSPHAGPSATTRPMPQRIEQPRTPAERGANQASGKHPSDSSANDSSPGRAGHRLAAGHRAHDR